MNTLVNYLAEQSDHTDTTVDLEISPTLLGNLITWTFEQGPVGSNRIELNTRLGSDILVQPVSRMMQQELPLSQPTCCPLRVWGLLRYILPCGIFFCETYALRVSPAIIGVESYAHTFFFDVLLPQISIHSLSISSNFKAKHTNSSIHAIFLNSTCSNPISSDTSVFFKAKFSPA